MLFTTVITCHSQSTINDYDISFFCDDDATVMTTVKSLLIPTIVTIASCSLFLNDTLIKMSMYLPTSSSSSSFLRRLTLVWVPHLSLSLLF